jgi:hypothetical protein
VLKRNGQQSNSQQRLERRRARTSIDRPETASPPQTMNCMPSYWIQRDRTQRRYHVATTGRAAELSLIRTRHPCQCRISESNASSTRLFGTLITPAATCIYRSRHVSLVSIASSLLLERPAPQSMRSSAACCIVVVVALAPPFCCGAKNTRSPRAPKISLSLHMRMRQFMTDDSPSSNKCVSAGSTLVQSCRSCWKKANQANEAR